MKTFSSDVSRVRIKNKSRLQRFLLLNHFYHWSIKQWKTVLLFQIRCIISFWAFGFSDEGMYVLDGCISVLLVTLVMLSGRFSLALSDPYNSTAVPSDGADPRLHRNTLTAWEEATRCTAGMQTHISQSRTVWHIKGLNGGWWSKVHVLDCFSCCYTFFRNYSE